MRNNTTGIKRILRIMIVAFNTKTGKLTVMKKLKRGTYIVKVKVRTAGDASHKPPAWKTVTFRVKGT